MNYTREDIDEMLRIREAYYQERIRNGLLSPSENIRDALDLPTENQQRRAALENLSLEDWQYRALQRRVESILEIQARDLAFRNSTLEFADESKSPHWDREPLFDGTISEPISVKLEQSDDKPSKDGLAPRP